MLGNTLRSALLVAAVSSACADGWRWPDAAAAESVRIDSKVRFVDTPETHTTIKRNNRDNVQADEIPFQEATDTQGFYNRPAGAGRYPVRDQPDNSVRINGQDVYFLNGQNGNERYSDGTLDSLQHCKCVSRPDCKVQADYKRACGTNQYLCCFNVPSQQNSQLSEYFNEVDDERPMLYPNQGNIAGPFPPPHESNTNGVFGPTHGPNNMLLGSFDDRRQNVLVGPDGPTGIIGPPNKQVLVGPGGPTGVVGPGRPVLVGPQGPTGTIGPANEYTNQQNVRPNGLRSDSGPSETAQRGVLVGPGGPTGIIGPAYNRPILVGPGGPTGIIGPRRQGVLVGPGGPTGIIGPGGFNRPSQRPGILVGPDGPTGIIGPGRRILVGPGGPTGQIGPRNYYGK